MGSNGPPARRRLCTPQSRNRFPQNAHRRPRDLAATQIALIPLQSPPLSTAGLGRTPTVLVPSADPEMVDILPHKLVQKQIPTCFQKSIRLYPLRWPPKHRFMPALESLVELLPPQTHPQPRQVPNQPHTPPARPSNLDIAHQHDRDDQQNNPNRAATANETEAPLLPQNATAPHHSPTASNKPQPK